VSRELDEKAALAIGWTRNDRGFWIRPGESSERDTWHNWPPKLSTDYARVPEMLAWLRTKIAGDTEIMLEQRCATGGWTACVWESSDGEAIPTGRGATIPEALAQLVVAVAEAKEKP